MKKAVMLFANGYEEVEALMTVDLLKRAGVDIRLVSINDDMTVTGSHGISVAMDTKLSRIQLKEEDAIIIPGGMPGNDESRCRCRCDRSVKTDEPGRKDCGSNLCSPIGTWQMRHSRREESNLLSGI